MQTPQTAVSHGRPSPTVPARTPKAFVQARLMQVARAADRKRGGNLLSSGCRAASPSGARQAASGAQGVAPLLPSSRADGTARDGGASANAGDRSTESNERGTWTEGQSAPHTHTHTCLSRGKECGDTSRIQPVREKQRQ